MVCGGSYVFCVPRTFWFLVLLFPEELISGYRDGIETESLSAHNNGEPCTQEKGLSFVALIMIETEVFTYNRQHDT